MQPGPIDDANLVITIPLPNADIAERDLYAIHRAFEQTGQRVSLRAVERFPIAPSWAEIAIFALTFFAGAAAQHYAEMLFSAFDQFLKKHISEINLTIRYKGHSVSRDVPRHERDRAIEEIASALEELRKLSSSDEDA